VIRTYLTLGIFSSAIAAVCLNMAFCLLVIHYAFGRR